MWGAQWARVRDKAPPMGGKIPKGAFPAQAPIPFFLFLIF
jgi:hypothetical protein